MKNSMFYYFVALVAAIAFSPVLTVAQTTTVDKNSVAKTETNSTANQVPATVLKFKSSEMEQAILNEINIARTQPQVYIQYLENYKKQFKGNNVTLSKGLYLETKEGIVPVDETIEVLKNLPTLTSYAFSDGLNKVVSLHMVDLVENPALSHRSKDGGDLVKRLANGGTTIGNYAENISFLAETARDIVLNMMIDDGFKSRAHRKNIFSPTFKVIGISFGKGKTNGEGLCVVNFADGYTEGKPKTSVVEF